jgi:hypothetical protein
MVPFAPSDPAWPTLVAASRTSVVGQLDLCVIVPNSLEYAREGDDHGGEQRMAVMAVDFSRWGRRSFALPRRAGATVSCGPSGQPLHGMRYAEDRHRIAEALLLLGQPVSCLKLPRACRGW